MLRRLKALARRTATGLETATRGAARIPGVHRLLDGAAAALDRALAPAPAASGLYGPQYFSGAGNPEDGKRSGYQSYRRRTSNADALALAVLGQLEATTALDVGCARGFVVEALREAGLDARGCDFSEYAINTAARGARGHLRWADLARGLPYPDGAAELVTCFETLEHLPPALAPAAVKELARVSSAYLVASIPSFGPRPPLPEGWFAGKLPEGRLAHYQALGPGYDGPVPPEDLALDALGQPLEGHLTIASFRWWRERFEGAGLVRCPEVELGLHRELERLKLHGLIDCYAFRHPGAPPPRPDAARLVRARGALRPVPAGRPA